MSTGMGQAQELFSHTIPIADADRIDALSLLGPDGMLVATGHLTLVAWGEAAVLELAGGLEDARSRQAAAGMLATVRVRDPLRHPGTGVLALGALPFDRAMPARLVVPEVLYGEAGETRWLTFTGPDPARPGEAEALSALRRRRHTAGAAQHAKASTEASLSVVALPEPATYASGVERAVAAIRRGQLQKVVLARSLEVALPTSAWPGDVVGRLHDLEPTATAFCLPTEDGTFVGASPELLVSRYGDMVTCHPLAGTASLENGGAYLLGSAKELTEHELVVSTIVDTLKRYCVQLAVPDRPEVVTLGHDARLGTVVRGELARHAGQPLPDVLELLAALHPTAAVGGVPLDAALEAIAHLEPEPRGSWAGPVGWVDGSGDGAWVIGIRSVTLQERRARVWAGAGVVAASNPEAELAETTLKLDPVVEALRGAVSAWEEPGGSA